MMMAFLKKLGQRFRRPKKPPPRVFIVHGWGGDPEEAWFPWLKEELKHSGFKVAVPEMPDTNNPTLLGWYEHLAKLIGNPDERTYLVGHSLGVITILRYLESLPDSARIGGAVLVSGFCENLWPAEIHSFFGNHLDFDLVRRATKNFVVVHSPNDPVVPFEQAGKLKEKLGAKLIVVPDGGHLNRGFGIIKLPEVLSAILEMSVSQTASQK